MWTVWALLTYRQAEIFRMLDDLAYAGPIIAEILKVFAPVFYTELYDEQETFRCCAL